MRKKLTIEELEDHNKELHERIKKGLEHEAWQTREIDSLRSLVTSLESDKTWLRQMHSAMLQATAEMFRKR